MKSISSHEIPLVIIREFKCESMIKEYHAYMNDWTPMIGESLTTRPEPQNKIDKYAAAVTKDAKVIGHLKKERLVDTLKPCFTSFELIQ